MSWRALCLATQLSSRPPRSTALQEDAVHHIAESKRLTEMAIIHQPQTRRPAHPAAHPSSSRASITAPPAAPDIPPSVLARAFTQQIIHIFKSARYPYPSVRSMWQVTLPLYISGILYAAQLPVEVGLAAMVLVFRYKDAVPHSVAYGDDAARLFLAAYIIAAKVVADGGGGGAASSSSPPPQTLDFWFRVSQKRFPVEELRRMELQLCRILRWDVQVSREALACIRRAVYQECGEVGDEALGVMEEEEEEEETGEEDRVRYEQYVERPPPPYCESERDVRVVETPGAHGTVASQGEYSGSRRGSWQSGGVSPLVRPQAQALIPSANGMTHEDYEDRQSFGRIFEDVSAPPPNISTAREENRRGNSEEKEKSLMAVVKERIFQIVLRKPSLPSI
ncbi:hypothetical protein BJ912DRAFT_1042893 [Pholiota molesta]|nr:hypothetical protein BJ912DRAFT_1042893 [Pholiota molesta]